MVRPLDSAGCFSEPRIPWARFSSEVRTAEIPILLCQVILESGQKPRLSRYRKRSNRVSRSSRQSEPNVLESLRRAENHPCQKAPPGHAVSKSSFFPTLNRLALDWFSARPPGMLLFARKVLLVCLLNAPNLNPNPNAPWPIAPTAQKSSGPKTEQGKAAASQNSFKHGLYSKALIIPGEDPALFEALRTDLAAEHRPVRLEIDLRKWLWLLRNKTPSPCYVGGYPRALSSVG